MDLEQPRPHKFRSGQKRTDTSTPVLFGIKSSLDPGPGVHHNLPPWLSRFPFGPSGSFGVFRTWRPTFAQLQVVFDLRHRLMHLALKLWHHRRHSFQIPVLHTTRDGSATKKQWPALCHGGSCLAITMTRRARNRNGSPWQALHRWFGASVGCAASVRYPPLMENRIMHGHQRAAKVSVA